MPKVQRVPGATPEAAAVLQQLDRSTPPAGDGVVTLEAPQFSRAISGAGLTWASIPHLGQGLGAVTALPQGRPATTLADGVRLEYDVDLSRGGETSVAVVMTPALDTRNGGGIRLAVGLDDLPPQELRLNLQPTAGAESRREEKDWARAVIDNRFLLYARFPGIQPGRHVVKLWRLDDNAVVQQLVVAPVTTATVAPPRAAQPN